MKPFRASLLREIRRFGADRTIMIVSVVIPVVVSVLFVFMFARGTIHNLPIAVYDADQSPASMQLVRMIGATPSLDISKQITSVEEGERYLLDGSINAFVYIPQGFESNIMSNSRAEVAAYVNGAFITTSAVIRRDLTTVFQAMNIGVETQLLGNRGIPASQGFQMAYPVTFDKHILFNPYGSYAYYLLPALLPLLLIIAVSLTTSYVLGSEFRYGTAAEWIHAAGGSVSRAVTAKLAPYFLIFIIIMLFMNTLLYRFLGLPFHATSVSLMLASSIFLIMTYMAVGIFLVAVSANLRFSLSISVAYGIAALSFAGLTFPMVAMYKPIAFFSHFFPFTYYIDLFVEQSMRGAPPARSLADIGAMGIFILIGFAILPVLKRKALDSKFYGKL